MLSFRRLAVTASIAAALAVPAAAQARPDLGGPNWDDNVPVSIDTVSGGPNWDDYVPVSIHQVSPDARLGEPAPKTAVVQADHGFEWGDAAVGGGAALVLTVLVGGAALTVRPRRTSALH